MERININLIVEGYSPRRDFQGMEELKRSIEKQKFLVPLTVRKDGEKHVIIWGARRFRVVQELGWETVPCIILDVDEKTAAHLSYLDNSDKTRLNLNPIEVSFHIKEMRERFGYSVQDLVDLEYAKDDQTIYNKLSLLNLPQEIQDKIACKSISATIGYKLASVKDEDLRTRAFKKILKLQKGTVRNAEKVIKNLINSERRKKEPNIQDLEIPKGDIPGVFIKDSSNMSELSDESVGLVVTSPPYNLNFEYEEGVSFEEHLRMLDRVFSECNRVLVPGGKICINFGDIHNYGTRNGGKPEIKLMGHHYQEILGKYGLRLIDTIIWKKCTPGKRDFNWSTNPQANYHDKTRHTSYRIVNNIEHIYIFEKNGRRNVSSDFEGVSKISKEEYVWWNDGVWKISPVIRNVGHPAQFPEEIPRRLIKLYSYKGDIVLDPFGGTMTSVKVANDLGRIGIGYEKDEKYKPVIMNKLGIKEEDLKKTELILERKKSNNDLVNQVQDAFKEFLTSEKRSTDDVMSVHVPVKDKISKDDIKIEWNNKEDDTDPSGSPSSSAICKPDDYAANEKFINGIHQGDCFELIKEIDDNSIDLVLTSPPYADVKSYGDYVAVPHPDDFVDWILPLFKEIYRILKPTGSFILNINDRIVNKQRHPFVQELIIRVIRETGLKFYDQYYWFKKTALPNGNQRRLNNVTEYLIHFCKDENLLKWNMDEVREPYSVNTIKRTQYAVGSFNLEVDLKGLPKDRAKKIIQLNERGKIPSNVFHFPIASSVRGKKHPATFHPALPSWFIKALTDKDDVVMDVFSGSGTTCLAAENLERKFIGFELNEEYQKDAQARVENAVMKMAA